MNMNKQEKHNYLDYLKARYRGQGRSGKIAILNELCAEFGCHRKHAVRLLSRRAVGRPRNNRSAGRKSRYRDYEFTQALKKVWQTTERMCSKHLKSAMPEWLPYIEAEHGAFSTDIKQRLLSISAPTIDRILKDYRPEKGISATRRGSMLKNDIPIQGNIWDIKEPGFMESDTVAHCGGNLLGDFVYSLTLTDIATTWTETRALWGKASCLVIAHLQDIEACLPFKLQGFDSDGGSEFINYAMVDYLRQEGREQQVMFTRSRAYQKNDNAHVEQKNNTVARRYLGYDRFDFIELAVLANNYMRNVVCPLLNHFHPSFKLSEKIQKQSRFKRVYKNPVTPYQRVMESEFVDEQTKQMLKIEHMMLNPVALTKKARMMRKQIDEKLSELRKLRASNTYLADEKAVNSALFLSTPELHDNSKTLPPPTTFKYRSIILNSSEALTHF